MRGVIAQLGKFPKHNIVKLFYGPVFIFTKPVGNIFRVAFRTGIALIIAVISAVFGPAFAAKYQAG